MTNGWKIHLLAVALIAAVLFSACGTVRVGLRGTPTRSASAPEDTPTVGSASPTTQGPASTPSPTVEVLPSPAETAVLHPTSAATTAKDPSATPVLTIAPAVTPVSTSIASPTARREKKSQAKDVPGLEVDFPNQRMAKGLAIHNVSYYRDFLGSVWVLGEVTNKGKNALGTVGTQVTLYDGKRKLAQSKVYYTSPRVLKPGQSGVWSVPVMNAPRKWNRTVVLAGQTEGTAEYVKHYYWGVKTRGVQVRDVKLMHENSSAYIQHQIKASGKVVNTGKRPATKVKVAGALYDESGRLVDVKLSFDIYVNGKQTEKLKPGQTGEFRGDFPRPTLSDLKYGHKWKIKVYVDAQSG